MTQHTTSKFRHNLDRRTHRTVLISLLIVASTLITSCQTLPRYEVGNSIERQVILTNEQKRELASIKWNLMYQAAFAISPDGAYGYALKRDSIQEAKNKSVEYCQRNLQIGNLLCKVHTVNGEKVIESIEKFKVASQNYEFGDTNAAKSFFATPDIFYESSNDGWDSGFSDNNISPPAAYNAPVNINLTEQLIGTSIVFPKMVIYFASAQKIYRRIRAKQFLDSTAHEWYVTEKGLLCWRREEYLTGRAANKGLCRGIRLIRDGIIEMTYGGGFTWNSSSGAIVSGNALWDAAK